MSNKTDEAWWAAIVIPFLGIISIGAGFALVGVAIAAVIWMLRGALWLISAAWGAT